MVLFKKWAFLLFSLKFHSQAWALGLALAWVCVFLHCGSDRREQRSL